MSRANSSLIPLNIVYEYPVEWSKYKVLRDYIQNFYDASSISDFSKQFTYHLDEQGVLTITGENIGFHYEWLVHIGASTKRGTNNNDKSYAGYFGEGFKIASLCAMRDHGWQIALSSQDWSLRVITDHVTIESKAVKSLAYEITTNLQKSNVTTLKLFPFCEKDMSLFNCALWSFYYDGNPLIGQKLFSNEQAALHYRSDIAKPPGYPKTGKDTEDGIIFASYQTAGSMSAPLVAGLHLYKNSDRDRKYYSKIDTINILVEVAQQLPGEQSIIMLEMLKKFWSSYPGRKYGYDSYYAVIRKLIKSIIISKGCKDKFYAQNPRLLVAADMKTMTTHEKNRRKQAKSWLKALTCKYYLVQDSFSMLGYQTLEEKCEEEGVFNVLRAPNEVEKEAIVLIEQCVLDIAADIFINIEKPEYLIITNEEAAWIGCADLLKQAKPSKNSAGFIMRHRVRRVYLQQLLFKPNKFPEALSVYLHEICHTFGGDQSASFSGVLTTMIARLAISSKTILDYNYSWQDIFSK